MYWARDAKEGQLDSGAADPFDEIGRAATHLPLLQTQGGIQECAKDSVDPQMPPDVYPEPDADAVARQVFAEFQVRCTVLDMHESGGWERELQASLADVRLIHIATRMAFEQGIANLLANGWQRGHHILLPVAAKLFGWESDLRRTEWLGMAGHTLYFALDQRAMYALQSHDDCERQRQVIARLRDNRPPATGELIKLMPVLAAVEARFPTWLALITNTDNIARWHQLDQSIPPWRRLLRRPTFTPGIFSVVFAGLALMYVLTLFRGQNGDVPTPQTLAAEHVIQGDEFLRDQDYAKALNSYDLAISADPNRAAAYSGRALTLIYLAEKTRALADLAKLESIAPADPVLPRARGLLAEKENRYGDAIVEYTRSLALDPESGFSLLMRGRLYRTTGQLDKALSDADRLLKLDRGNPSAHQLRAQVFFLRRDFIRAKGEATAVLTTANEQGAAAYRLAAIIYEELGDLQAAFTLRDKVIKLSPRATDYLNRAALRPRDDFVAARADIEAALMMAPGSADALRTLVKLELQAKQWDKVLLAADRAMKHPSMKDEQRFLLTSRAIAYAKQADTVPATEHLASARLAAKTPNDLNSLCYELAVHEVALTTALANCNASLEGEPGDPHALDSKAFTLLRMKRYRESLTVYDAAVEKEKAYAHALYGRGLVKHRLGDKRAGRSDINAALALRPGIGTEFVGMGLVP